MGGVIGFGSPFVTCLWALSLAGVLWWLGREMVKGRLVSQLSTVILFSFFFPIIIQYPFTFSPINSFAVGVDNYSRYRAHVDVAFLITMAGMTMIIAGYLACGSRMSDFAPMKFVATGIRAWTQGTFLYLSSLFILLLFGLLLSLGMLGAGGARSIAQSLPALRPFYNVAHIILPLTITLDLLVGVQRRRPSILFLAVANLGLAVLTGTRSAALGGVLLFVLVVTGHASLLQRLKVRQVLKLFPAAAAILLAAIYLGDVRAGQYNVLQTIANLGLTLFYGNNFSDLRDFAWVRSYWDGQYYLGRTQAAGLLAFIPSAISPFRAEWNWGVVTTTLAGLDPLVTPGLRAGAFGEAYFNFGMAGVLIAGLLYGYFIRRVHNVTLLAARRLPPHEAQMKVLAGFVAIGLAGSFLNTAGFFGFYITMAILGALPALDYTLRAIRATSGGTLASRPAGGASPL